MAMSAFEISKRQPVADGRAYDDAGPYEQIDRTAHFGVDPAHPDNQGITDIALETALPPAANFALVVATPSVASSRPFRRRMFARISRYVVSGITTSNSLPKPP